MGKLKIALFIPLGMIPGLLSWDQPLRRQEAGSGGEERRRKPRGNGRPKGVLIRRAEIWSFLEQSRKGQRCMSDECPQMLKTSQRRTPRTAAIPSSVPFVSRTPRSLPEVRSAGGMCSANTEGQANTASAADGSEEALNPPELGAPPR